MIRQIVQLSLLVLLTVFQNEAYGLHPDCDTIANKYDNAQTLLLSEKSNESIALLDTLMIEVDKLTCPKLYYDIVLSKIQAHGLYGNLATQLELIEFCMKKLESDYNKAIKDWHNLYGEVVSKKAHHFLSQNDLNAARENFKLALSIYQSPNNPLPNYKNVNATYLWIAECYRNQGSYKEALDYIQSALSNYDENRQMSVSPSYYNMYQLMARNYIQSGQHEIAHEFFKKAIVNFNDNYACYGDIRYIHQTGRRLYQSYADFWSTLDIPDSTIHYLNICQKFDQSLLFTSSIEISKGKAYLQLNQYQKALEHLNVALRLTHEQSGPKSPQAGSIYKIIGDLFQQRGRHNQALIYYQKALTNLVQSFESENYTINPTLSGVLDKQELMDALFAKAHSLHIIHLEDNRKTEGLIQALSASLLGTELIDLIKLDHITDYDKELLAEKSFKLYEQGIELVHLLTTIDTAHRSYYAEKAFQLSEKGKSATLMEGLKRSMTFPGVPSEVITRERQIDSEILFKERRLLEIQDTNNSKEKNEILSQLGELRKSKRQLFEVLKKHYPAYYEERTSKPSIDINYVQQNLLDDQTAIIEYFVGEKAIYTFYVSKEKIALLKKETTDDMMRHFRSYRDLINDITKFKNPEYASELSNLSSKLYEILFADVSNKFSGNEKNLIIIQDGMLHSIPFELLRKTEPLAVDNKVNYLNQLLLNYYSFSYPFSASLLKMQCENNTRKSDRKFFLGLAPSYDVDTTEHQPGPLFAFIPNILRGGLKGLAGARREVQLLKKITSGKAVIGQPATKAFFLKNIDEYDILHLSMHYIADEENPLNSYLPFENKETKKIEKLFAHELYNVATDAKMVVLSACNTGDGPIQKGEGVKSLSRAFTYAGAASTVMSLWKVPDFHTQFIMNSYYSHLEKGLNKSEALRQAKLECITQHPKYTHPFYWAGFVVAGDISPIEFPASNYSLLIFVAIITATIFILTYYRSRRYNIMKENKAAWRGEIS